MLLGGIAVAHALVELIPLDELSPPEDGAAWLLTLPATMALSAGLFRLLS